MPSEPLVRISGVDKSYDGETLVVADLSLEIARGEFLTLLGPSGSGKTTTLMMLAGFETPTRGTIAVDGQDVTRVPPHRRGIGMVFQNYALFPHMSVAENVGFPLGVRGVTRTEAGRRVDMALDMVRLGGLGARMPSQLSGGQQQRVALARALIFEPRLVLMDEPLGALDKQLREHMQYEIKSLHERLGVTVVYVTHDQGEALTMSDRIAIFDHGRIQQIAGPRDIYEHPETDFVAGFIGETNRIPCRVSSSANGRVVVSTGSGLELTCACRQAHAPGDRVTVAVRPERLRIGAPPEGRALEATVEDVIYHGDHLRLHLEGPDGLKLVAKMPPGSAMPARGSSVAISWNPDDARVLPAGDR